MILPLTVLRRLDCVLAPTKDKVLRRKEELRGRGLQDLDGQLRRASVLPCTTRRATTSTSSAPTRPSLRRTCRNYIAGFSQNMREVLERFDFELPQEKRAALITRAVTKGLNSNAAMKDSGVEWLGRMPVHWTLARLRHLVTGIEQGWSPQCENHEADDH